jgi:hypothetical protein
MRIIVILNQNKIKPPIKKAVFFSIANASLDTLHPKYDRMGDIHHIKLDR